MNPKKGLALGVFIFLFGLAYLYFIVIVYGANGILGNESLKFKEYPFQYVTFFVIPFSCFIVSIILVAKYEFKARKDKDFNKSVELFGTLFGLIFILIIGLCFLIYSLIKTQEKIYLIIGLIFVLLSSIKLIQIIIKHVKIKQSINNFKTKKINNLFDYLVSLHYKKMLRNSMKQYIKGYGIKSFFNDETKALEIEILNDIYEISFIITKKDITYEITIIKDKIINSLIQRYAEEELEEILNVKKIDFIFDKNNLDNNIIDFCELVKLNIEKIESFIV